jgi:carboxymethylenebutenolidase
VVVQEAFGVNDHIEDVCSRLAAEGYLVVAPHVFHRTGDPKLGYDDMSLVMPHFAALTADTIAEDMSAAFDHLVSAGVGASETGVVGFCMGGTVTLVTATQRALGAAVTFYGGGVATGRFGLPSLIDAAPRLRTPWLGLYADLDTGISVAEVEDLRAAAASSDQRTDIVRYPDAQHGFNCDRRGSYHEPSARDAWARMLAWFEHHLVGTRAT